MDDKELYINFEPNLAAPENEQEPDKHPTSTRQVEDKLPTEISVDIKRTCVV